jgi:hypothetical protein
MYEEIRKEVGQWVLSFISVPFTGPAIVYPNGTVKTPHSKRMAEVVCSAVLVRYWCCVAYILVGGIKVALLPVKYPCKK